MKTSRFGELAIVVASSHSSLGLEVTREIGIEQLEIESGKHPDQELNVRRISDVSGKDVCIISSITGYDSVGELSLICNSVKGSASRIFAVATFVAYGKSDHQKRFGEVVAYKDIAMKLSSSGVEILAIFDQHSAQHPSFYDTTHYSLKKVHHLYFMSILIKFVQDELRDEIDGVLALDAGGFNRNTKVADIIKKPISFIIKHRDKNTKIIDIEKSKIVGDIKGKRLASFDDMCQSGGTIETGARIAKLNDAESIKFFIVHNDFDSSTFERLNPLLVDGTIDKIYIVETIPVKDKEKWHKNLIFISPAKFIARTIELIHTEGHMREMFLEM